VKEKIKQAIDDMVKILELVSGATEFQLRTCAYYATANWHLSEFDRFGYLVYYGNSGIGKTETMTATSLFCCKRVLINASTETSKMMREKFDEAKNGTAVLEEFGDTPLGEEVYNYLNGRYARGTATAGKMEPGVKANTWKQKKYETFGATLIHRLEHFKQPTLENRSIWLYLQFNPGSYVKVADIQSMTSDIVKILDDTKSIILPTNYDLGKSSRTLDTYEPILRLAHYLDDKKYLEEIDKMVQLADAAFRDGQTYHPKALVLRGLIAVLTVDTVKTGSYLNLKKSVKVNDITKHITQNYQQGITPRQAHQYLKEMQFTVRGSGGYPTVMAITAPQLAKACLEQGITDDLVTNLMNNP
jgi:hypothetical protein